MSHILQHAIDAARATTGEANKRNRRYIAWLLHVNAHMVTRSGTRVLDDAAAECRTMFDAGKRPSDAAWVLLGRVYGATTNGAGPHVPPVSRWFRVTLEHMHGNRHHVIDVLCFKRGDLWYATSHADGFVLKAAPDRHVMVALANFADAHDTIIIEVRDIDRAGNTLNPATPSN